MTDHSPPPPRPTVRVRIDRRLTGLEHRTWRSLKAVPLRWWIRTATVALVLAIALYVLGLNVGWMDWFRDLVDRWWRFYDDVLARVSPWAALLPLAIAYVAYRVYRADQWWKRAEWALDAASEGKPHVRQRFGDKAIDELLESRMAPTADLTMFDAVVAERYSGLVREVVHGDPTVARPRSVSPGVDDSQAGGGQ
ncbi:hypothetical protein [Kocuria sp. CPCC 205263]|uniref:hypothetical protein n=1 Tax=Kocuria sp. CPCC 205263 TaxID=3073555 RepID=UPI0034D50678